MGKCASECVWSAPRCANACYSVGICGVTDCRCQIMKIYACGLHVEISTHWWLRTRGYLKSAWHVTPKRSYNKKKMNSFLSAVSTNSLLRFCCSRPRHWWLIDWLIHWLLASSRCLAHPVVSNMCAGVRLCSVTDQACSCCVYLLRCRCSCAADVS